MLFLKSLFCLYFMIVVIWNDLFFQLSRFFQQLKDLSLLHLLLYLRMGISLQLSLRFFMDLSLWHDHLVRVEPLQFVVPVVSSSSFSLDLSNSLFSSLAFSANLFFYFFSYFSILSCHCTLFILFSLSSSILS